MDLKNDFKYTIRITDSTNLDMTVSLREIKNEHDEAEKIKEYITHTEFNKY